VFVFKGKNYLDSSYPRGEVISEQEFTAEKFPSNKLIFSENFEASTFDFFHQLLNRYNKISHSDLGGTLDKALKSYYEASVASRLDHSVFYYWLTIESLLKVRPMKYEEMKRILKKLIAGHDYVELITDTLVRIRHGFAHEAIMEVESPTRNFAKSFCDSLVDWFLLEFGKQFTSKRELGKIYAFIQEDNESLRTDKKIIDTILSIRPDSIDT
jgi:PhoPQ-activated pathogenicity-related protein